MTHLFSDSYLIYKVKGSDLYAAVSPVYQRDIRQYATEYQSLSDVPADKQVLAVIFKDVNEDLHELKKRGDEAVIPVNCLEFDTGNFKLSA